MFGTLRTLAVGAVADEPVVDGPETDGPDEADGDSGMAV